MFCASGPRATRQNRLRGLPSCADCSAALCSRFCVFCLSLSREQKRDCARRAVCVASGEQTTTTGQRIPAEPAMGPPPLGSPYPSECPSLPPGRSGIIIAPRCWRTAPAGSGDVSRRSPFPLDAGCSQLSPALRSFAPFLLITRGVDTESHAQAREKHRGSWGCDLTRL